LTSFAWVFFGKRQVQKFAQFSFGLVVYIWFMPIMKTFLHVKANVG